MVLKNPSHLFALDALFATYPDALVVQCHRPAETIMASMCSLSQHTTEGWSNSFVGAQIGQDAGDVVAAWSCSMPNGPNMIRPSSTTSTTSISSPTRCKRSRVSTATSASS